MPSHPVGAKQSDGCQAYDDLGRCHVPNDKLTDDGERAPCIQGGNCGDSRSSSFGRVSRWLRFSLLPIQYSGFRCPWAMAKTQTAP